MKREQHQQQQQELHLHHHHSHNNNNSSTNNNRHANPNPIMFATPHLQWPPTPAATDEDDSLSRNAAAAKKPKTSAEHDGATIEVVRRPRGRPPGSKNKPKPPVVITRDAEHCAMRPHVLEIPTGVDLVDSIVRFARHRNVGLCVLSGTGSIANVSLRQPSTTPGATVTFHGRFDILSISATYLPSSPPSPSSSPLSGFAVSLAGPQGQIFGGAVAGPLVAASTVFVVATTFSSPSYHRLPAEEEEDDEDDQVQQQQHQQQRPSSGGAAHTSTSSEGEERGRAAAAAAYGGDLRDVAVHWAPPPPVGCDLGADGAAATAAAAVLITHNLYSFDRYR
ncbi:hypothetical protein Syun_015442 [Stephania yunnanensis]|uniref:AT-hook motif nuclear-localized protein n=1 Tax=Stephania yunnanensis TaxID=152371 RepID=A0AAP0JNI9_9MAGN